MNGRNPFFGFGDPFANFGSFGDQFSNFGGSGGPRDLMSSFFGGRDPFADPFFTRPFGGMFESSFFGPAGNPFVGAQTSGFLGNQPSPPPPRSRGPVIEELNSDEEKDEKEGASERKDNPRKHGRSSKESLAEVPDDESEGRKRKQMQFWNGNSMSNIAPPQHTGNSFSYQSSTVTFGGGNGTYYTSSTTRRTGSDGMTFEEKKEADSATRQAAHKVSRGIHGKGHSVSRKLNSDGRVDTMQTLHNLEEDELASFEEKWKENAARHFPGWSGGLNTPDYGRSGNNILNAPNRGNLALPYAERPHQAGHSTRREMTDAGGPSRLHHTGGKANANVGGQSGSSSHGRSRDQSRRL